MTSPKIFIAVAGNIGTGKTTLTKMLSERFSWKAHFEVVADNPYLADFYSDMSRWSFPLQVFFLNTRFKSHQNITEGTHSAIQDRSIYEDANIFARNLYEKGNMEKRDFDNYIALYHAMNEFLSPPGVIVYLKKSLPRLKERITQRGRDYEQNIPDEYLADLNRYYNEWMDHYDLGKKLIIESDHLDFVKRPEDFDYICNSVLETIDQGDLFLKPRQQSPIWHEQSQPLGAAIG